MKQSQAQSQAKTDKGKKRARYGERRIPRLSVPLLLPGEHMVETRLRHLRCFKAYLRVHAHTHTCTCV